MTDKILQLDFDKSSCEEIIKDLMPTIDHHRSKGKTLPAIYAALCKKRLLSIDDSSQMAIATFRKWYYKYRQSDSVSSKKIRKVIKTSVIEEEKDSDLSVQLFTSSNISDGERSKSTPDEKSEESSVETEKGFKRLELGGTLEEQFEIGSMYFRQ
ncbi:hypothetical protein [cf. Phormidesmis sp. LEGE 11477]|uniref:hypothetical protein n=1 Tax=cf. Phormidesmis sp. LEGE 11477 TaxID=1828680 RepID=UPI0018812E8E|nr:hypothetical protein [cf. Phormidesmis sp. LEGE 11477]MBE9062875.1 hypothetical protein [cf. Phormidesmis sp. LEGE 11477]